MASRFAAGRQRDHLAMSDDEFDRRLGANETAFGADWLSTSDTSLARLWQRKDGMAVNQLCLLGDAISGLEGIDPNWVADHVKKIKSTDANSRRGSLFELMGVNPPSASDGEVDHTQPSGLRCHRCGGAAHWNRPPSGAEYPNVH
ncbi:hypothetical protein NLM33_26225 [Bradyrhizobium sp. CCGUVB1N3]|uniref:hypothetical protein n=1 Tax=Bradyrhizobium sp. CCGUVB1N3 TaxID=2949629 RepID=UPI0020B26404|nr:hypothetical protein [Bradyrhizobium sp. CCGUVB1N3]MCP3473816.1 hypothetical protein [Bradyrhizobium sp. CCGUVB1N3]